MAQNDIKFKTPFASLGAVDSYRVKAGTTASINEGEPVFLRGQVLGTNSVSAITATQALQPSVGTDWMVGISVTASNETATLAGTVSVYIPERRDIFLCAPTVAASWNTQAEYTAFVGCVTRFDVTGGVITVKAPISTGALPQQGSSGGLIVAPLDVTQCPGQVAFFIRAGVLSLA